MQYLQYCLRFIFVSLDLYWQTQSMSKVMYYASAQLICPTRQNNLCGCMCGWVLQGQRPKANHRLPKYCFDPEVSISNLISSFVFTDKLQASAQNNVNILAKQLERLLHIVLFQLSRNIMGNWFYSATSQRLI